MPKSLSKWGQGHLASLTSEDEASQAGLALITDVGCWLWGKAAFQQVGLVPGQLSFLLHLLSRLWWGLGCSGGRGSEWEGR